MGARPKAWVYGLSLAGIAGSNPAVHGSTSLVNGVCCACRGLCDKPIYRRRAVLPNVPVGIIESDQM